jgi:hypothetical protein
MIHYLENVKSYMSHLQQYTKIIKIITLQTYFSLKFINIEEYKKPKKRLIFTF